ncbi:hypothetical protein, partial [Georgenia sp. Z1491]|uniref:hypothetical protein n=1 Tax=Georgenia sp. Z1491 TaxID=3416707 RepID=UPI003CFB77F2
SRVMDEPTLADLGIDFTTFGADDLEIWLSLYRVEDDGGLLRGFRAEVTYVDLVSSVHDVGTMTGWCTRWADSGRLADAGDCLSTDAAILAAVAEDIVDSPEVGIIEDVLMIDRVTLAEEWRGHKLLGAIVTNVVDLLQVYPSSTIAVTQPEPLSLSSGKALEEGPLRDAGMAKLHRACAAAGFQQWEDTIVWWRTFDDGDANVPFEDPWT